MRTTLKLNFGIRSYDRNTLSKISACDLSESHHHPAQQNYSLSRCDSALYQLYGTFRHTQPFGIARQRSASAESKTENVP